MRCRHCPLLPRFKWKPESSHRVAMTSFWRSVSIMMEKWAQPVEEGGSTHTPFHYIYHHIQSCGVRSRWEDRYPPLFLLYPCMYTLWWKNMRELTYIGDTSIKFLCSPRRFLLDYLLSSWFLLIHSFSSLCFSNC